MVSLTTLNKEPPSRRKIVPWLPATVAQPSMSSRMALQRTLMTSAVSSLKGPSSTSTTSFNSSRRNVLLSLIFLLSVMAVSFTTLWYNLTNLRKASLDNLSHPSSRKPGKSLLNASSGNSTTSAGAGSRAFGIDGELPSAAASPESPPLPLASSDFGSAWSLSPALLPSSGATSTSSGLLSLKSRSLSSFSAPSKKATNSSSSISPSLPLSNSLNKPSLLRFFSLWLYRITLKAPILNFSSSAPRFLPACSRKRVERFVARDNRPSILPILISSCFASVPKKVFKSLTKRSSMPSLRASICLRASATEVFASLMTSSVSSARATMLGAGIVLAFTCKGWTCFSALLTSWSASSTAFAASLTLPKRSAFMSVSTDSFSSRSARRLISRSRSRAVPIATRSHWNWSI
mmetsp:Transcript_66652/g.168012  ORF Transcript_66652/g.168012 Transcript_66652/m.168012 type:complete len:405 (-) Transcript_66652:1472-2686(-)